MLANLSTILRFLQLRITRRAFGFGLWTLIWIIVAILFSTLYNSISEDARQFEEVISTLPQAITSSFNIGSNYLSRVETFLSGQFLTVYTLIGSIFAYYMGLNELGGKINDRTISQWLTKDISRISLSFSQWFLNTIYLSLSSFLIWSSLYFCFSILTEQDIIAIEYFIFAALGTGLLFIAWMSIGHFAGLIISKNIAQNGGIALIVLSWFWNSLSSLGGFEEELRAISLFYLFDNAYLRDNFQLEPNRLWILLIISLLFVIVGSLIFRRKNLFL